MNGIYTKQVSKSQEQASNLIEAYEYGDIKEAELFQELRKIDRLDVLELINKPIHVGYDALLEA